MKVRRLHRHATHTGVTHLHAGLCVCQRGREQLVDDPQVAREVLAKDCGVVGEDVESGLAMERVLGLRKLEKRGQEFGPGLLILGLGDLADAVADLAPHAVELLVTDRGQKLRAPLQADVLLLGENDMGEE